MVRFHKLKNRLHATNQLDAFARMSLYYTMKTYPGDITVHGVYKFGNKTLNKRHADLYSMITPDNDRGCVQCQIGL